MCVLLSRIYTDARPISIAVTCKLCGESTKRHAVLCSTCGIISHRRCTEFAPSCDLRAQLLGPKVPLYPAATISSIAPASSTSFSFTDYLPGFNKSRRPKARPTSSDSSIPPTTTSGKAATAKRHHSNLRRNPREESFDDLRRYTSK